MLSNSSIGKHLFTKINEDYTYAQYSIIYFRLQLVWI